MTDLEEIRRAIETKPNISNLPIKLVAIDGHGGAGKSTLAAQLAAVLEAEVLHTDDFASWHHPRDWWPRLIDEALEPIKAGVTALSYARGSWGADHHPAPVTDQPVTSIMILEGVSAARREFRPYLTYAIWVETPRELCLKRGLERDGQDALPQWQQWLAGEDAYIERDDPQAFADIKVSGVEPRAGRGSE